GMWRGVAGGGGGGGGGGRGGGGERGCLEKRRQKMFWVWTDGTGSEIERQENGVAWTGGRSWSTVTVFAAVLLVPPRCAPTEICWRHRCSRNGLIVAGRAGMSAYDLRWSQWMCGHEWLHHRTPSTWRLKCVRC